MGSTVSRRSVFALGSAAMETMVAALAKKLISPCNAYMPTTHLRKLIRDVANFPKDGILFKDITPLLKDPAALSMAVELMANPFRGKGIHAVAGAESRGFIFGIAVAQALSCGFIPIRKRGKLPPPIRAVTYDLEYGQDTLEVRDDAVSAGQKILMVDDLLATGGTMRACVDLMKNLGANVFGATVLIELKALNGRAALPGLEIHAPIVY
jgi:adenine phosphoribosyltransferase